MRLGRWCLRGRWQRELVDGRRAIECGLRWQLRGLWRRLWMWRLHGLRRLCGLWWVAIVVGVRRHVLVTVGGVLRRPVGLVPLQAKLPLTPDRVTSGCAVAYDKIASLNGGMLRT